MAAQVGAVKNHRQAHIIVGGKDSAVRVFYPGKLALPDVTKINDTLVNDVIKGLTGCPCMSGMIDVIWERDFDRVLDVELGHG